MQARRITVTSLTLAGLCVSFCNPARAQPAPQPAPQRATDTKPPVASQPAYPAQTAPEPGQQPYQPQPYPGNPYQPQPYPGQPYQAQPYPGQPYQPQPYQGQPYQPQPYDGQPYQAQPYDPSQPQPYYPQPSQPQPYYPQPSTSPGYNLPRSTSVRYVNRPRTGLIVAGAVTLGVTWSLSALIAAYSGSVSSCGGGAYDYYATGGCYDRVWPLFIPVVGPWIQMGFAGNDSTSKAYLALDGLAQAGGLAMLIAGAVTHTKVAVYAKNGLQVNPLMVGGGSGLLVSGRF